MAIAFDASSGGNNGAANSSLTVAHTVTGFKPALCVFVKVDHSASISSVTYNGTAMTAGTRSSLAGSYDLVPYYLLNPSTGTNNIVVTLGSNGTIEIVGLSYTGVDSGSIDTVYNATGTVTNSLTTSTGTISSTNEMVVQGMSYDSASGAFPTITPASSGTARVTNTLSNNNGLYGFELLTTSITSYTIGGSLSGGTSANLALAGISLKAYLPTTFTKSVSVSVSKSASRVPSLARAVNYIRKPTISVSNSVSRLATVAQYRFHIFTSSVSVSVSNAVSRLATVFDYMGWRIGGKSSDGTNTYGAKSADSTNTIINKSSDPGYTYKHKS